MILNSHVAAYIAGIVDGEGCIAVYSSKHSTQPRAHLSLQVKVSSTDHEILIWLRDITGIGQLRLQSPTTNRRPAWLWETRSQQAANLLKAIRPWLRIKAAQADTAIEFNATMTPRGTVHRVDETVYQQREVLRLRLKAMKRADWNSSVFADLVGIGDIRVETE